MILAAVQIHDYKSIRDSNRFEIGDVTCLVGKNESGKTALLEAIYRLNPLIEQHGRFDVTEEYPRSDVEDYQQDLEAGRRKQHAIVITATFNFEPKEIKAIEGKYGEGVLKSPAVTLRKGYENKLHINLDLDESVAVKALVESSDFPGDIRDGALQSTNIKALHSFLETSAQQQQQKYSQAQAQANALGDSQEKAKALDEAKKLIESESAKQLRSELAPIVDKGFILHIWESYCKNALPKFLYFDEYYQMSGQLNVQKLMERQAANKLEDSDRPMLGLIDLARIKLDQLMTPQNTEELVNKLEGASNHLSKQILKYWSQNQHISVQFDIRPALPGDPEGMHSGTNLWGRVHDSAHKVSLRLGTRSRGFIWFFSFLAWFSQQKKLNIPLILLLDEPGLFLHASAQADLLRYIEAELKPYHQVIYTSHSPFMIDARHFERVRIVLDRTMERKESDEPLPVELQGTKVFTDVLEADEGSLFPLQGALAYDITQTLFVGPNSLIIEGVSDMFYIQGITDILQRQSRTGLSSDWTLCPVGGSDKVPTFIALLGSQKKLNIATLIDLQKKDKQKIENLFKRKLLEKKQVRTFAEFTESTEADIEDMFDVGFYLSLVNAEYVADIAKPIVEADLSQHTRILPRLEDYFKTTPLKNNAVFNHYRPARYFAEHLSELMDQISPATLTRFETAFKSLNGLL
jgi:predicted ATP-dependent endonuclease of OLD family